MIDYTCFLQKKQQINKKITQYNMLLIKFGGSSVGSVENLQRVVQIVKKQTEPFIMVVSAFSGVTNTLQSLGENALKNTHQPILEALKERHISMAKSLLHINKQTNALVHIGKTVLSLENLCNSIDRKSVV